MIRLIYEWAWPETIYLFIYLLLLLIIFGGGGVGWDRYNEQWSTGKR